MVMIMMIMMMMMIMITYIPKNGGQGGEEAVVDKRDYRRKMAFPGFFRSNYLFVRRMEFIFEFLQYNKTNLLNQIKLEIIEVPACWVDNPSSSENGPVQTGK